MYKTYDVVLYECSACGYATPYAGNAARHAATKKCSGGTVAGRTHRMVKFEDTTTAARTTAVRGFECSACGHVTCDRSNAAKHAKKCGVEVAPVNLKVSVLSSRPRVDDVPPRRRSPVAPVVRKSDPTLDRPDADMRTAMMRAIPLLGARMDITSLEDLPALLFRTARGTDAPARYLAVVGNAVTEMKPTGGTERTSIDKFVRRVVAFAADACVACGGQDLCDELDAKDFVAARGERESRSDLIRMYSSGDHRYYRASYEGKEFVRKTADAVRDELDAVQNNRPPVQNNRP
jgi:Zn ribbon nucleic-acid-binding protein